jgi:hypothetical protein
MATVRMLSPLALYLDEENSKLARRPPSLDGKVLGLLPNWRPAAVNILKALTILLEERFRLKAVVLKQLPTDLPMLDYRKVPPPEILDELAKPVDVMITASGD